MGTYRHRGNFLSSQSNHEQYSSLLLCICSIHFEMYKIQTSLYEKVDFLALFSLISTQALVIGFVFLLLLLMKFM